MYKGYTDLVSTQTGFPSLVYGFHESNPTPYTLLQQFRFRVEAYHFAAMYDMPFCKSTFGYESLKAIKLALSQHDVDLVGEQLDIVLGYIDPFDNNLRVWAATEVHMGQDMLRQSESGREIVTLASATMQNDWQELER
jgi:hypothetical protein